MNIYKRLCILMCLRNNYDMYNFISSLMCSYYNLNDLLKGWTFGTMHTHSEKYISFRYWENDDNNFYITYLLDWKELFLYMSHRQKVITFLYGSLPRIKSRKTIYTQERLF